MPKDEKYTPKEAAEWKTPSRDQISEAIQNTVEKQGELTVESPLTEVQKAFVETLIFDLPDIKVEKGLKPGDVYLGLVLKKYPDLSTAEQSWVKEYFHYEKVEKPKTVEEARNILLRKLFGVAYAFQRDVESKPGLYHSDQDKIDGLLFRVLALLDSNYAVLTLPGEGESVEGDVAGGLHEEFIAFRDKVQEMKFDREEEADNLWDDLDRDKSKDN